MTSEDPSDRVRQGIDHWAQHGVEEFDEREAADRAERGDFDAEDEVRLARAGVRQAGNVSAM